jgi:hypothetical protein
MRSMNGAALGFALALGAFAPSPLSAQVELYGVLARPVGAFGSVVGVFGGGGASVHVPVGRSGIFGLRLEAEIASYGYERYTAWVTPLVPNAYVDITTSNLIATAGVGPQLTLGFDALSIYGFATVGTGWFGTVSSVSDRGWGDYNIGSSVNFSDLTYALAGGGGISVALSRRVSLSFVTKFTNYGDVTYLTRGRIRENDDGTVTVYPIRSNVTIHTMRLGIGIGI